MRADRLISLIMLLQKNKLTPAKDLAKELEVSIRTIYRDIVALHISGIPVYALEGPGGGYGLLGSYRSKLTGLNEDEIRAFFMMTIPSPIFDLGVGQQVKSTMLKLTSTQTDRFEGHFEFISQRLYIDTAPWFQTGKPSLFLKKIKEAVWQDLKVQLEYRRRDGKISQKIISPYSLVSKGGIWYMVSSTDSGMRVYRISRIENIDICQKHFHRPENFDLSNFWTQWATNFESNLPRYSVTLKIGPDLLNTLHYILGEGIRSIIENVEPDPKGWRILEYTFEREEEALSIILSMGSSVEVIFPSKLKKKIIKLASDVLEHYKSPQ